MNRRAATATLLAAALGASACKERATQPSSPDAAPPAGGLGAEQATRVVARIDDRVITLGDFARALERMDQFDRLRYQTKERRRELLGEMIDVELLADEARRRGLDKDPETADAIRAVLRDAMLAEARVGLPTPAELPADEVRAYYEHNQDKFSEPERRRVAAIVVADKREAEKILREAQKAKSPADWGELFFKHSLTAPKTRSGGNPAELAGDLGIVGPPDDPRGDNPRVPAPARAMTFKLDGVGTVAGELVEAEGKQYILRLNGVTPPHRRSLAEADRSIRVLLVQEKMQQRERALEDELRKKYPVEVDDKALAAVKMPSGMDRWFAMDTSMWPDAEQGATAAGTTAPHALGADGGTANADAPRANGGR
jgi:peptidyl-prolyl cis-trans isomerase C